VSDAREKTADEEERMAVTGVVRAPLERFPRLRGERDIDGGRPRGMDVFLRLRGMLFETVKRFINGWQCGEEGRLMAMEVRTVMKAIIKRV